MKQIVTMSVAAAAVMALVVACANSGSRAVADAKTQDAGGASGGLKAGGPLHMIDLPHYQANLPPAPGREAFAGACLSCHSTRYITMQPPLTAAKWEESARKMVKVYGAPIAEDQVQPIAQYIVAALAADAGPWETPAVVAKPPPQNLNAAPAGANAADVAVHGTVLYAANCASCHGRAGDAQTPAAATMLPRPTDLTSATLAPNVIAEAIVGGVRGTPMPGYPNLSREDVNDVTAYVQSLAPKSDPSDASKIDLSAAKTLYAQHCSRCHGDDGAGQGIAAPPLARPPANFKLIRPTAASAARIIADGVPGSAMPAWKSKLSEPQRTALAEYVRTFYAAPTPR